MRIGAAIAIILLAAPGTQARTLKPCENQSGTIRLGCFERADAVPMRARITLKACKQGWSGCPIPALWNGNANGGDDPQDSSFGGNASGGVNPSDNRKYTSPSDMARAVQAAGRSFNSLSFDNYDTNTGRLGGPL